MANLVYKRLFKLALAALLASCASEPVNYQAEYPKNTQQSKIPSVRYPVKPPYQHYSRKVPYSSSYGSYTLTGTYANSPAVRNFIQHMVHEHGFSEAYLNGLFSHAHRLDSVIRLESPAPSTGPSKPGSWTRYRNKFLTDAHISNGVEFWRNNADADSKSQYHLWCRP